MRQTDSMSAVPKGVPPRELTSHFGMGLISMQRKQALGFQFSWITIFGFYAQRSWETISKYFLALRKWEPTS